MSVALENARLFDETQRLLKETEQRATELSAISTVSQALVAETDLDSMIQLVGSQMREIFEADIVYVALLDKAANLIRFPFTFGETFDTLKLGEGLTSRIIQSGEPILLNKDLKERRRELGTKLVGRESLSYLGVPIKSGRETIGVVSVQSTTREGLFDEDSLRLLTTIAANIGIAIEHARLFGEIQTRNREITENLEQQTATSEILRVTASSPTDIQPVLDVIAENARRLCGATLSAVYRTDGKMVDEVAVNDLSSEMLETTHEVSGQSYPAPLDWESSLSSRAILSRATLHIPDLENEPGLPGITRRYVKAKILKSALFVPMLREGEAIGCIGVGKRDPSPFTEKQITLLQTFASQAVIAIENVRLFNELQDRNREITENLEQQTATSEILHVMASSPTYIQPVLDAITENAVKLLGGDFGNLYRTDGKTVFEAAGYNFPPEAVEEAKRSYPAPLARDRLSSRTILDRKILHLPDMRNQPDLPDVTRRYMKSLDMQCIVMVPLMREGEAIGCIGVGKHEPSPFTEKQINLLQTFASQAVIAIENVRLFNELQQRNHEITENLEQQTATSDVLRVIAQSPTNVQPVLDVIAENARRLLNGYVGGVYLVEGDMINEAATSNFPSEAMELHDRAYPRPLTFDLSASSRAVLERAVQNLPDILSDSTLPELTRQYSSAMGMNSLLVVPMMRDNEAIGSINVGRLEAGLFTEKQIALLRTFASQAVIAIENVRLFNELQQRNREIADRSNSRPPPARSCVSSRSLPRMSSLSLTRSLNGPPSCAAVSAGLPIG